MLLSEWFRKLNKERGIASIRDLTCDEKQLLQTKYGIINFGDILKCDTLIKCINDGSV